MTTALLESPLSLFGEGRRSCGPSGSGITLEAVLESALRSVRRHGSAECPVCHASMYAERGAARCSGCGSTLS
jgi:hypothetical protein